jgi:hypothetical protein
MGVWNSHLLSTKLRRVLDTELTTAEEIAKISGSALRTIQQLANGANVRLGVEERERISRSLAPYFRNNPDLYREPSPPVKRGVFAVELRARDWRAFEVKNSDGRCIMYVEWPVNMATQSRIDGLWRWLDREDPAAKLSIV